MNGTSCSEFIVPLPDYFFKISSRMWNFQIKGLPDHMIWGKFFQIASGWHPCALQQCQHNAAGEFCEQCAPGHYGDATAGTPEDCQPCGCPLTNPENMWVPLLKAQGSGGHCTDSCVKVGGTGERVGVPEPELRLLPQVFPHLWKPGSWRVPLHSLRIWLHWPVLWAVSLL